MVKHTPTTKSNRLIFETEAVLYIFGSILAEVSGIRAFGYKMIFMDCPYYKERPDMEMKLLLPAQKLPEISFKVVVSVLAEAVWELMTGD